jgi:hypothetical protein
MPHKLTAPFQIDQEHFLDKLLVAVISQISQSRTQRQALRPVLLELRFS